MILMFYFNEEFETESMISVNWVSKKTVEIFENSLCTVGYLIDNFVIYFSTLFYTMIIYSLPRILLYIFN